MTYNIKDFGAVGDGIHTDTEAIQKAADRCKEANGGTIVVPAGKYLCSSIRLYSDTTVILEKGAEILVSNDESLYGKLRGKYDTSYPRDSLELIGVPESELTYLQRMYLQGSRGSTDTLFFAQNADNITVTGPGKINGQWKKFFYTDPSDPNYHAAGLMETGKPRWQRRIQDGLIYSPIGFRPQIFCFIGCKNTTMKNFTIYDAPFFTVHMIVCNNYTAENLTILNDIHCVNTDGINLYGCKNAYVGNCYVVSGDDSIALSGNISGAVIEKNTLKSSTNGIRIFNGIDEYTKELSGIGNAQLTAAAHNLTAQDITVSGCTMEDGGAFLTIEVAYGKVRNVRVEDCKSTQKSGSEAGIFLGVQDDAGSITDVSVDHFTCEAHGIMTLQGFDRMSIVNVSITNSVFTANPRTCIFGNGMIDPLIYYWLSPWAPYNLYIRHATNVKLQDVSVKWGKADLSDLSEVGNSALRPADYNRLWRTDMNPSSSFPAIDAGDVDTLILSNVTASAFGSCETVRLRTVSEYSDNRGLIAKTVR